MQQEPALPLFDSGIFHREIWHLTFSRFSMIYFYYAPPNGINTFVQVKATFMNFHKLPQAISLQFNEVSNIKQN